MKRDIVISNHFTTKRSDGTATRGATPGQFVTRYMSRDEKGATEPLAPFMLDAEDTYNKGTKRYYAREEEIEGIKAETLDHDGLEIKRRFKKIDGLGGRAFGSRNLSLSDRELKEESNKIQQAFDENHAVQLMVISFSEKFLREYDVLDDDFVYKGDGSYRNNYDQMKLRMAITRGVSDMTDVGGYANPVWVGTLQVDTSHLHCHLALCDTEFSDVRTREGGDDRGKIWDAEKSAMRHGIARQLDLMRGYSFHHKGTQKDQENVLAFVKDVDFHEASYNRELQLVMGSLPEDKTLWNTESTDTSMKYPNEVARGFVQRLYNDYPEQTGYREAYDRIVSMADDESFVENGRKELIDRGVNALYRQIAQVDDGEVSVKTDLLRVQSMDDDSLKRAIVARGDRFEEFDPYGFELRTRAYTGRIRKHVREVESQAKNLIEYNNSAHTEDASRMGVYYVTELRYHAETADKYRSFFAWNVKRDKEVRDKYNAVEDTYTMLRERNNLYDSPIENVVEKYGYDSVQIARKNQDEFNARVQLDTNVTDASLLFTTSGRRVYREHTRELARQYRMQNQTYAVSAYAGGQLSAPMLVETLNNGNTAPYAPQAMSDMYSKEYFNEVKAHDLHDLDVDYYGQSSVGFTRQVVEQFADQYNRRLESYVGARDYLEETDQSLESIRTTERDLYRMRDTVEKLYDGEFEVPELVFDEAKKKKQLEETITLDTNIQVLESLHDELSL